MWPIVTDEVTWSVCLSVCPSVTTLNGPAETTEAIEMPFQMLTYLFHKSSPPHTLPSSLRTDSTDFTTGPFLLSSSVFSERELTFTFAICYRPPVRPSVCLSV